MAIGIRTRPSVRPGSIALPGTVTLSVTLVTNRTSENATLTYKIDGNGIAFDDGAGGKTAKYVVQETVQKGGTPCNHEMKLVSAGGKDMASVTIALEVRATDGDSHACGAVVVQIDD